jgi:predicted HTH transcriptional regulator
VEKYGKEVYHFGSSFIQCVLPYNIMDKEKQQRLNGNGAESQINEPQNLENEPQNSENEPQNLENEPQNNYDDINATTARVLEIIKGNTTATKEDIAQQLKKSASTIKRCISILRKKGYIEYVGVSKNGCWKILK